MKILIKLSGKIIDNEKDLKRFVFNIKKLSKTHKLVIVHGGGKQVSFWSEKLGLKPKFVNGLRYTDKETLDVVISVLCGLVNKKLVFEFIKNKIKTVGLSCVDNRIVETDLEPKLGFVGKKIKKVNTEIINLLLKQNFVVLISSVGITKDQIVNINADNVAYAISKKLKVDKLIFLTDKEGVLDRNGKVIKILKVKEIKNLIKTGVVTEGMIPKLESIKDALNSGVKNVVISNKLGSSIGTIVKR